jgi:hypothetical protein
MEHRMQGIGRDSAGPLFRTSAVVHMALALGPTTLAAVAWVASRSGAVPSMGLPEARVLLYTWLVAMVGAALVTIRLWGARAEPLDRAVERGSGGPPPESLLALLIPVWAVLEAPALFGVVLFLLTGAPMLLASSLLYLWIGFWLTRPRRAWFSGSRSSGFGSHA